MFRALGDEHHVRTFFEDSARGLDGIFHAAQARDGAGAKSGGIHDDGVTFDVAIQGEMGTEAGVEGHGGHNRGAPVKAAKLYLFGLM